MDLYRAEATRSHRGKPSKWRGKFHKDPKRAIQQAIRWGEREPEALIAVVTDTGAKVTLEELEQGQTR